MLLALMYKSLRQMGLGQNLQGSNLFVLSNGEMEAAGAVDIQRWQDQNETAEVVAEVADTQKKYLWLLNYLQRKPLP